MTSTLTAHGSATLARHQVTTLGPGSGTPVVLGHGFGCDQSMWSRVAPELAVRNPVVLFDHVGTSAVDPAAFDPVRHATLWGYAEDVVSLLEALGGPPAVFVGHSASAMIGVLAAVERPDLFRGLVLVGGSPRYLDDEGYRGGFSRKDVDDLLSAMESNYLGWASALAPVAMGNPDRPELADELAAAFTRNASRMATSFARAIFLSDHRAVLPRLATPALVVQSADDPMVPSGVADYLHASIRGSALVGLAASGHFPHVSGPDETARVIQRFVDSV